MFKFRFRLHAISIVALMLLLRAFSAKDKMNGCAVWVPQCGLTSQLNSHDGMQHCNLLLLEKGNLDLQRLKLSSLAASAGNPHRSCVFVPHFDDAQHGQERFLQGRPCDCSMQPGSSQCPKQAVAMLFENQIKLTEHDFQLSSSLIKA